MKSKTLYAALLFALFVPVSPAQQQVTLTLREGMPVIPLALPDFIGHGPAADLAESFHDIVLADMRYSRVYSPLPSSYYSYIRALDPQNIFFQDWQSIQAKFLVVGEVFTEDSDALTFEAKVYDVKSGAQVLGKRYKGEHSLLRRMAHSLSDELMKIRGEPTIFTSKVVFVSNRDGNDELYMMDYDGQNQIRLTFNTYKDYIPAWSSDGQAIAYVSYRGQDAGLYILRPYEGKRDAVTTSGTNSAPSFSPDGKKLAFCSTKDGTDFEIYACDADGKNIRRLTFNRAADVAPSWSPTSRQIAFTSDRGGTPQIYTMDAEGSNPRRVSFGGSYHDAPAWSPDGDRIAYVSRVYAIFDIYVLNTRTQKIIKLTEGNNRNESPCWSADGRHLIFSSDRSGRIQLYSIDYDGSNLKQLTYSGDNKLPDWTK